MLFHLTPANTSSNTSEGQNSASNSTQTPASTVAAARRLTSQPSSQPTTAHPSTTRVQHTPLEFNLTLPKPPTTESQRIVYEKEKLLHLVAKPTESWELREARIAGLQPELEAAAVARWGRNLRDLDMLDAERERGRERNRVEEIRTVVGELKKMVEDCG